MFSIKANQLPVRHSNFTLIKSKPVMLLEPGLVLVMPFAMNHAVFVLLQKMLVRADFQSQLKEVQKPKFNVKIIKMAHAMSLTGR